MYSHRCCSSAAVNCVRLLPGSQEGTDADSITEHPLLSRAPPAGVLVNRWGIRDPTCSNTFIDPLDVFYVLRRGTFVLLDKLHERGCLVVCEDNACTRLRRVRIAAGMLFLVTQHAFHTQDELNKTNRNHCGDVPARDDVRNASVDVDSHRSVFVDEDLFEKYPF